MADPVATNVMVGGAVAWYAPVGEPLPDETSVAFGGDWGGNWARVGYTGAPLAFKYEDEHADLEVEEHLTALERIKTKEDAMIETVLREITPAYLALVTGGSVASTAAGASQVAFDQLNLGGQHLLTKYAFGFEGVYIDATGAKFPRRFFIYRATTKLNGDLTFSKRNGEFPGIPFQAKALVDPSKAVGSQLVAMQHVTAAASS